MELAYDFEKWGTNSPNNIKEYTAIWLKNTFPFAQEQLRDKISRVLHGYIKLNSLRRPEAQNADIYHPCHYLETDKMLKLADEIDNLNEEVFSTLNEKDAYYSMIYFPAKISINLLKMNLYAGKNNHFARQGKKTANKYSDMVTMCINKDRELAEEFASFKNGKWKGMEMGAHIGFVKWNEDNCRYPLRMHVEPAHKPRMAVSRKDREEIYSKTYGTPMTIIVDDFLYPGNDEVILEIANDGIDSIEYTIEVKGDYSWLEISSFKGKVEDQEEIILRCKREKLTENIQTVKLLIKDKETVVAVDVSAKAANTKGLPSMTFLQNNGVITIEANHYCDKKDVSGAGFFELKNYGRSGCAMKVFPTVINFGEDSLKPSLTYRFLIEEPGEHIIEVWTTPTNPVQIEKPLRFLLTEQKSKQLITAVPSDFKAGSPSDERWCEGVLNNIRICKTQLNLEKGLREITIGAIDAGFIIERILIYREEMPPLVSYLGPPESFFITP